MKTASKSITRADLEACENYEATYCPEDDKIRLYVGRVPRDEYDFLRAEGWTATPKQGCDFVAVWTPSREKTALQYAGIIGDEDQDPADRAADRAERFSGYRDKRTEEATGHADRFDSQPLAHGFQNERKAERAAARHDRIADKATDQWSKAEYWTRRTAGVISHALYKSSPEVRMGRIKTLEAEQRKNDAEHEKYAHQYRKIQKWAENPAAIVEAIAARFYSGDKAEAEKAVCEEIAGYGKHSNPAVPGSEPAYYFEHIKSESPPTVADYAARYLATHNDPETGPRPWADHLALRLAYEHQMLEAQGGRAAMVEMEVGGWLGKHQIRKINRSNATGRVVSIGIMFPTNGKNRWGNADPTAPAMRLEIVNIERMESDIYTPPSEEDKAALATAKKAEKAAAPKVEACPLINPTDEDAERLQALWNEEGMAEREAGFKRRGYYAEDMKPAKIIRLTQAKYSEVSSGSYASAGTRGIRKSGFRESKSNMWSDKENRIAKEYGKPVCKLRICSNSGWYTPPSIIIITDKPQKAIPAEVWEARKQEAKEELQAA